jgi:predicted nucleic acid-binding protein
VVDAVHVVTGRRHGARLVTRDRRLHTLCGLAGVDAELVGA